MSAYPKPTVVVYKGRRLSNDKKILHVYGVVINDVLTSSDLYFSKRIASAYGIGTMATLDETKEGTFAVGGAKYLLGNADVDHPFRDKFAGWQAEDHAAHDRKALESKIRGEDVWKTELASIKSAYKYADRGTRAIMVAKIIQFLESP